jgi:hypothetical protein
VSRSQRRETPNSRPETSAILDQLQLEGVADGVHDRVLQHRVDTVAGSPLICPIAMRTLCALAPSIQAIWLCVRPPARLKLGTLAWAMG